MFKNNTSIDIDDAENFSIKGHTECILRVDTTDGRVHFFNFNEILACLEVKEEKKELSTMDKSELERRLEAAEKQEKQNIGLMDEIENLKAKLAEMQDEPEIPDMPVFHANETYWTMFPTLKRDKKRRVLPSDYVGECYNLFHTKEYADEFAKKCKLIAMMLHCKWYLDRDYVPDWSNNDDGKFYLRFYYDSHEFATDVCRFASDVCVCFSTEEKAQKCADWLNKRWKENADG